MALANDINLEDPSAATNPWTPIGTSQRPFTGTFDGRGHIISGLHSTATGTGGLFGYVTRATIANFILKGSITSSATSISGVVANYSNSTARTTIRNVGCELRIESTATTGNPNIGGIIAKPSTSGNVLYGLRIEDCYFNGSIRVTSTSTSNSTGTGGIVGYADSYTFITNCYNAGTIEGCGTVGGIAGALTANYANTYIQNSYNSGEVSHAAGGEQYYLGAITGHVGSNPSIITKFTNLYYLEDSCYQGSSNASYTEVENGPIQRLTAAALSSADQVAALNVAQGTVHWKEGNEYPVLSWEKGGYGVPVIDKQPVASSYATQGTMPAALSVTASKPATEKAAQDGTLSWQWYSNTEPSTEGATLIDSDAARKASFTPPTDTPGATYYYCEISNSWEGTVNEEAGSASTTSTFSHFGVVTATTPAIPEITSGPVESQIVTQLGETEPLTVVATVEGKEGAGTLSWQWYEGATSDLSKAEPIKGANAATYTPSSGTVGTTYYFCTITNTLEGFKTAEATTRAARVQITGIPISTPLDLLTVAENVNSGTNLYAGATLELMNDINLQDDPATASWTPIGNSWSYAFQGSLYGNGHTIRGLSVTGSATDSLTGLFGYIAGATLKDFIVKGSIDASEARNAYTAGVAAYAESSCTINSVGSEVDIVANSTASIEYGGIVSFSYDSITISSCYYNGTITGVGYGAGGIVGNAYSTDILACYNLGTIEMATPLNISSLAVGGIVGTRDSSGTLVSCYSTGAISFAEGVATDPASASKVGALVGTSNSGTAAPVRSFFLENIWQGNGGAGTEKSEEALRAAVFLTEIDPGGLYYKEGARYPVLTWEQGSFDAPVITTQPEDGWAEVGTPATALSVEAETPAGTKPPVNGTLSWQWYQNSSNSTEGGAPVEGARDSSYIPSTATEGETWYYCVITNTWTGEGGGSASVASRPARFYVASTTQPLVPVITEHPQDAEYATGSTAEALYVTVEEFSGPGAGTLRYQWYALTGENPDPEKDTVLSRETKSSYVPPTALPLGTYGYYCVVANTTEGVKTAPKISYVANVRLIPRYINDAAELLAFSESVRAGNSYAGCTIELTKDIDLAGVCGANIGEGGAKVNWIPIGFNASSPFSGTFDGAGYTIKNLYFLADYATSGGPYYQGLFGQITGAVLKNFVVEGTLTGRDQATGGVVAMATSGSMLENVGSEVTIATSGTPRYVGGLVGRASGGLDGTPTTLLNCYNEGTITATGSTHVGGLVGGGLFLQVEGCYNTGEVTIGSSDSCGSLVGSMLPGRIWDCYTTGTLTNLNPSFVPDTYGAIVGTIVSQTFQPYPDRFRNNYYLEGVYTKPHGDSGSSPDLTNNHPITDVTDMQSVSFVENLNRTGTEEETSYFTYVADSYPKLYWEDTTELAGAGYDIEGIITGGYDYTGSAFEPSFTVANDQGTLSKDTDYTVSYSPNINAGTVTLTVTGAGDYRGRLTTTFDIKPVPLTVTVNSAEKGYSEPEPAFTGEAPGLLGSDTLAGLSITRETGEDRGSYPVTSATALIEGGGRNTTDNYDITVDYAEAKLTINALDIESAGFAIAEIDAGGYLYTGRAITPQVSAVRAGITLDSATDYTLGYSSNVNAGTGTATITVTGKDNYTGELSTTFTINRAPLTITADNKTKVSDEADPQLTYTVAGLKGTDTVTSLNLTRAPGETAGSYDITATGATVTGAEGNAIANYAISYVKGSFTIKASDTPDVPDIPVKEDWPRLDGNKGEAGNRFDTMQAIVQEGWTTSDYVIVAYSHDFPDALAASSLAGIYDAPVILTEKETLTSQAKDTIAALGATKAYIIGGEAAVSGVVADSLATLMGGTAKVERVAGDNRFNTALDIYREGSEATLGWSDTAIIANGFNFADALSVSPFANATRSPIFLSTPTSRANPGLDTATLTALTEGGFKKV
ncbi:MAG: cell wall-binding repeat-containing protein, partial [Coriobacteriales bacterium]|nr:cell wall-binding repeat-containing protein [Coriobacteriales bacterium]